MKAFPVTGIVSVLTLRPEASLTLPPPVRSSPGILAIAKETGKCRLPDSSPAEPRWRKKDRSWGFQ